MCQQEWGCCFLFEIFVCEDREQDSVHTGSVAEGSHRSCSSPYFSEASFDSVGGPQFFGSQRCFDVLKGQQFGEVSGEAVCRLLIKRTPFFHEPFCLFSGFYYIPGMAYALKVSLYRLLVLLFHVVKHIPGLVSPATLDGNLPVDQLQSREKALPPSTTMSLRFSPWSPSSRGCLKTPPRRSETPISPA